MDAQKISEAASTIKKVDHALAWLDTMSPEYHDNISVITTGNPTYWSGHGEVLVYLREAMEIYRDEMLKYARERAEADKRKAQDAIREQAGL